MYRSLVAIGRDLLRPNRPWTGDETKLKLNAATSHEKQLLLLQLCFFRLQYLQLIKESVFVRDAQIQTLPAEGELHVFYLHDAKRGNAGGNVCVVQQTYKPFESLIYLT